MLSDEIGDGGIGSHRNELNLAKSERLRQTASIPCAKLLLWFRPPPRKGDDEATAPSANVVANVDNNLRAVCLWAGRISDLVGYVHGRDAATPNIVLCRREVGRGGKRLAWRREQNGFSPLWQTGFTVGISPYLAHHRTKLPAQSILSQVCRASPIRRALL